MNKEVSEESKNLLAENDRKLESCDTPHEFCIPVHRFTEASLDAPQLFCKFKCSKCGLAIDAQIEILQLVCINPASYCK